MKMMKKKVVVATALGLTSMVLGAACGYGPPTYEYDDESTMQSSADADNADAAENSTDDVEDNNTNNTENNTNDIEDGSDDSSTLYSSDKEDDQSSNASTLDSSDDDDYYDVEPACVYGPPSAF